MPDKMTPRYMRRYGFEARTIIDVGVLNGTPFLYEAWPDRKFVLVDPLEESRESVAKLWPKLDYTFHVVALGAAPGSFRMDVEPGRLARSTVGTRMDADETVTSREVEVVTLDSLTADLEGPLGLKIDTEGHELEVLRGATDTLARCEFVIAETSIKKRFDGGYRFSEVIAFMAEHGFEAHSFLSGLTRAPRFSDVLFIPADDSRFDMAPKDAS
ncbi:FkbM family methyltransferase [uncultured Jannaschia sp.]|uniref:FkbM family methyltransferase n=1 Tax=uncultured Jannaschia sp. TaxID=293347 RepID=UPI00262D6091|nr:FkbM family methyltransferase [uncultured Jannaschia sp.]